MDPTGKNVFVLLDESGAKGSGHLAIIIGNSKDGYSGFSLQPTSLIPGVGTEKIKPALGKTFMETFNRLNSKDQTYSQVLEISTTSRQDRLMTNYAVDRALKSYSESAPKYDLTGNHCGTFVRDTLTSGLIDNNYRSVSDLIPKNYFETLKASFDSNLTLGK